MQTRKTHDDLVRIIVRQGCDFEQFLQSKLDELNVKNQDYNAKAWATLDGIFPHVLSILIDEYGQIQLPNEMKLENIELNQENKVIIIQMLDEFLGEIDKEIKDYDDTELDQCLAILFEASRMNKHSAASCLFLREQFYSKYILKILNLKLTRLPNDAGVVNQAIKNAVTSLSEMHHYVSLNFTTLSSGVSKLDYNAAQYFPAIAFLNGHSVVTRYVRERTNNLIPLTLRGQAEDLLDQIAEAGAWVSVYMMSNPDAYPRVLDYKQMDLLTRISFATLKLMHNPDERNIAEYQLLRRETAQYSRLKLIASSMGAILGLIMEVFTILPQLGLFLCNKRDYIKPNFVLRKSVTFFKEARIARQMDQVVESSKERQPSSLPVITYVPQNKLS